MKTISIPIIIKINAISESLSSYLTVISFGRLKKLCILVFTVIHNKKMNERQQECAYVQRGNYIILGIFEFCYKSLFVSADKY